MAIKLNVCGSCSEAGQQVQREQQKSKGLANFKVKCSADCGNVTRWHDSADEAADEWNDNN